MAQATFPRNSLQPLIIIGMAHLVPAATQVSGILRVFGASVTHGTIPNSGTVFTHKTPFPFPWKIVGYSIRLHKARGAIGEVNAGIIVKAASEGAGQSGNLFGWASDLHAANVWFENMRTLMLSCPILVPAYEHLYFTWLANNILAGAADYNLRAYLYWTYAIEEELQG